MVPMLVVGISFLLWSTKLPEPSYTLRCNSKVTIKLPKSDKKIKHALKWGGDLNKLRLHKEEKKGGKKIQMNYSVGRFAV